MDFPEALRLSSSSQPGMCWYHHSQMTPRALCSLLPCTVLKAFSDSQVTKLKTKVHLVTCNPAYCCPSGALSSCCPCSLAVALQSLHLPGHYRELLLPSAIPASPELKSSPHSIIIILSNRSLPEWHHLSLTYFLFYSIYHLLITYTRL